MIERDAAKEMFKQAAKGATIRASILAPLVRTLKADGRIDDLVQQCGIPHAYLRDPYAVMPLSRYVALFEQLAEMLESPTLGVRIGLATKAGDLGPVGLLFTNAPTLRTAFTRLSRYIVALQGGTHMGLQQLGQFGAWSYRIEDRTIWPRRQDAEYSLAVTCTLAREGLGADWSPLEVHFEHDENEHRPMLERFFRTTLRFRQPTNRLIFAAVDLDRPLRREDPDLTRFLERHVNDLIAEYKDESDLCNRVRAMIATSIGMERITIGQLAKDLNCSQRTLQRELARKGTSLRSLLRERRQTVAEMQMSEDGVSNATIAHAVGYADSTVFGRAFKSWTGESPSQFRRR